MSPKVGESVSTCMIKCAVPSKETELLKPGKDPAELSSQTEQQPQSFNEWYFYFRRFTLKPHSHV